jgi:tetratricopeptide (TPR) repeat protein
VAWVAERKDLLCALFFLLSVMAYIRHAAGSAVETHNRDGLSHGFTKHYLAALVFFVLALLSKPMAVSLPAVLIILDWHPFNRIGSLKTLGAALLEKSPFIVFSLFSSITTVFAQKAGGALQSWEFAPLSTRLIVGGQSLIVYLGKMMWPLDLVPYYPYPKNASFLSIEYGSAIACAIGITIACAVTFRKQKIWLSAWGYYFITLLPVLGIVQVGGQSMADRYTYLPSFGPSFVIGLAVARAWVWMPGAGKMRPALQLFSVVLAFFLLGSLTYLSLRQIEIWKDSVALWSYVIEKEPDSVPVAYNNRGLALKEAGRFDEAIADFEKTIALDPSRNKAYNNLGVIYLNAGLFDKSIECFNKSIAINPTDVESYNNRGAFYAYTGQYEKALEDFSKAIELKEDDAAAYYNRGSLYRRAGREELAVPDYQKACEFGIGKACAALR